MCLFDLATVQGRVHRKVANLCVCVGSAVSAVSFRTRVTEGKSPWAVGNECGLSAVFFRTFIANFFDPRPFEMCQ